MHWRNVILFKKMGKFEDFSSFLSTFYSRTQQLAVVLFWMWYPLVFMQYLHLCVSVCESVEKYSSCCPVWCRKHYLTIVLIWNSELLSNCLNLAKHSLVFIPKKVNEDDDRLFLSLRRTGFWYMLKERGRTQNGDIMQPELTRKHILIFISASIFCSYRPGVRRYEV